MDKRDKAAHFDVIKENNKRLIRNLVRKYDTVGKAELAGYSGLSVPTVAAALYELVEAKMVLEQEGKSNGGRPGSIYTLNPNYAQTACMAILEDRLIIQVFDYCGTLLESAMITINQNITPLELEMIRLDFKQKYINLKIVVLGIPGIATTDGMIIHLPHMPHLQGTNVKKSLSSKLDIEVFIENDINAIAMSEIEHWSNFAHIIWTQGCIGSAIILDGHLIRGIHGGAGELEFICNEKNGKLDCLQKGALALACALDLPLIAISGEDVTSQDAQVLTDYLTTHLASYCRPEIVYVPNEQSLYLKGLWQIALAHLTK